MTGKKGGGKRERGEETQLLKCDSLGEVSLLPQSQPTDPRASRSGYGNLSGLCEPAEANPQRQGKLALFSFWAILHLVILSKKKKKKKHPDPNTKEKTSRK